MDPTQADLPWLKHPYARITPDEVWNALVAEFQAAQPPRRPGNGMRVNVDRLACEALDALREHFEAEAKNYRAVNNLNALVWWRDRLAKCAGLEEEQVLRTLAPLARMLLSTPASSASAERIFAGYTHLIEGRERLGFDRADTLLQLQHFVRSDSYDFNELIHAMVSLKLQ